MKWRLNYLLEYSAISTIHSSAVEHIYLPSTLSQEPRRQQTEKKLWNISKFYYKKNKYYGNTTVIACNKNNGIIG